MKLTATGSQTVGPYFHLGLTDPRSIARIVGPDAKGERITLACTVLDGDGVPVPDAMLEIWQANASGKYDHPEDTQDKPIDAACSGFGRMGSDANGVMEFETIKPGRVPGPDNRFQAPHLNVSIFARGLLKRLPTRIYFAGDRANDEDPVLALVPKERRDTLLARRDASRLSLWRFVVHLQGEQETVFFDV
jgi:protocatechuate 3,4-dioxygenase alpha subunit